jgi:Mrp family chromosome partitioning ATPase
MNTAMNNAQKIEQKRQLKDSMDRVQNKILVMSGKGGVGKTTVAVNLAYGLALKGYKTGLLDVDIHGPNITKMLGVEGQRLSGDQDGGMEPISVTPKLKAVSISCLLEDPDKPIIWRGPIKMQMIQKFLGQVNWGNLDYLIIDSPPGTGDEPLSVCQLIDPLTGAIIVTTPQDVAILDSRKSVQFAKELKIPVVGIIENMSGFICPHCQRTVDLFKTGGGQKAADSLAVPFLGRIPLEPDLVKRGDGGHPFIDTDHDGEAVAHMRKIMAAVEKRTHEIRCLQ